MKTLKRIFIGLAAFLVVLFIFLLVAPILFKDEIVARVKSGVNESLEAEVDFADVDVSFLRSFPDIALTVEDFSIVGVDTFAGLPLARGELARVDLGFWSVVAGDGNYAIDAVALDRPDLNFLVLSPELANYLIVPETEGGDAGAADTVEAELTIALDHFEVNDGSLVFDDRTTGTYVKLRGLNATGDGDFTQTVFDVATRATAEAFTLRQEGVTYLDEARMTVDGVVNIDSENFRYTFTEAEARINELDLLVDGSIDLEDNDDILFDLDYSAPANDFRQLWSIIPAAYTEGYDQVRTGGSFTLSGTVNGAYNAEREVYPAFTLGSQIENGSVQYPGRPVGITDIQAELLVESPGSDLDQLVLAIPTFRFELGGDPFRGSFRLARPLSDPTVDARLDGALDLGKWSSAIPLEGVRELDGRIVADVSMNDVRQSALEAGRYADVKLGGDVLVSNLVYVADGTPPVRIAQARADFTPQSINLEQFTASLGRSDVSATARITNFLAYFTPDETLRGSLSLRSNFFDADEWITEDTLATVSPAELTAATSSPTETTEVFDRFDFDVDAEIEELTYGSYRPSDLKVVGNIKPNRLDLADARMTLDESSFTASGTIRNLFDYTFDDGVLAGNLSLRSGYFNVNDFIVEDEGTPAPTSASPTNPAPAPAPIPVPRNIDLTVDLLADRVQYTDITMNGVRGTLRVNDGAIFMEDGRANLLGGSLGLNGSYDTQEDGLPGFHFAYDIQNFDFGQAFGALNTFSILAPVGKFISGTFSSELVMEGKLGDDLMPVLESIDAAGLLRTAEARIASFRPLQVIGTALNVKELRESATLKNIIAAFEIEDGTVAVKPFDFQLAGIGMQLGGTHGLNTDMDYQLRAAVPRALVEGNIVTGTALSALDKLAGQADRLGLSIRPGDTLNLAVNLTGSISDPRTSVNLLGTKGGDGSGSAAGSVVAAAEDRLRDEVNTRVDSARTVAETQVEKAKDSLRSAADQTAAALKNEATNQLKDVLTGRRDSTQRPGIDSLNLPPAAKDAVEDVKKELEKFNPFKRRKSGGG
jgi:hypothetical protein